MFKIVPIAALAALSLSCTLACAETLDAAKALLDGAVAEVKASGMDQAIKDFNAGGKWNKGTLDVVMANFDGLMVAHSANDKIPGKNMLQAKDAAGKPFVKEAIGLAMHTGNGQIDIRWGNPATQQSADATMFVKRVPGHDAYVGSVVFN